jgi:hypothetical protein
MRSQVQVLAGPPSNPAGQSAAGSGLGALAAGLGRAGAARPSPPARPVAPSGPPTRPSGSATTTHRGRAPNPRTAATPRVQPPRAAVCPSCPPRSRPRRALRTPAWPAWSLSGHARPARPAPNPAARVRHRPPTDQRDVGSVARGPASSTVDRAVDGPAATGASTRSGSQGRPASSTWSPRHRLSMGGDGRVRTDRGRHQMAGHRTGGQQTAGRVDGRRPTAGPAGRPAQVTGHRTAGQPDPGHPKPDGWTPHAGQRRPTPWPACWQGRARRRRPTCRDRLDAAPGRRRLGEQPPGPRSRKDAEGIHAAMDGSGHRRDRQLPVVRRRPAGALAHCCPRKRLRVERRASGSRSSVMASAYAGGCCGGTCGAGYALSTGVDLAEGATSNSRLQR